MARAVPCGDGWEDAVAIIRAGPGGKGTATVAMACPVRHGAVATAARVQAGRAGASSQRAAVQILACQESESPEREKAPSTVCKYPGGLMAFKGTESSPKFSQPRRCANVSGRKTSRLVTLKQTRFFSNLNVFLTTVPGIGVQ